MGYLNKCDTVCLIQWDTGCGANDVSAERSTREWPDGSLGHDGIFIEFSHRMGT